MNFEGQSKYLPYFKTCHRKIVQKLKFLPFSQIKFCIKITFFHDLIMRNNIVYNLPYSKFKVCSIFFSFAMFQWSKCQFTSTEMSITLIKKTETTTLFLNITFTGEKISLFKDYFLYKTFMKYSTVACNNYCHGWKLGRLGWNGHDQSAIHERFL